MNDPASDGGRDRDRGRVRRVTWTAVSVILAALSAAVAVLHHTSAA